jgi:LysM repeat protein
MKRFSLWVFCFLTAIAVNAQNTSVKQYIDSFKDVAMKEMIDFKIPASITLAQGLLESGSGNSRLAKEGNNHFGIKCKKDWTGCTILEDDDALQECFRCYSNPRESYYDHSKFLRENRRYAPLFTLTINDYKAWANGLLTAGYATNPKYSELLIATIERNKLMLFDSMVLNGYIPFNVKIEPSVAIVDNKVPSTLANKLESPEQFAKEHNSSEKRILKYNDMSENTLIEPGEVLYLKPKKKKASVPTHLVQTGETMWLISQKYAVKLNALYKKNLMEEGTEPKPGVVLQLQNKATTRPDTGRVVKHDQRTHIVLMGETLYAISKQYGITVDVLKTANKLVSDQISRGQELIVPDSDQSFLLYEVKLGDTLFGISKKFGKKVEELKSWNQLTSDSLQLGQKLKIHQ